MSLTLSTVTLVRLIPYLIVVFIAYKKGFLRFSLFASWLIFSALLGFVYTIDANTRSLLSCVTAVLLLNAVLDLNSRNKTKGGDQ